MVEIPDKFKDLLNNLLDRLYDSEVNWAFTGSHGLCLQGVPVQVHDIDVQTDQAGAYQVEKLFVEYSARK